MYQRSILTCCNEICWRRSKLFDFLLWNLWRKTIWLT